MKFTEKNIGSLWSEILLPKCYKFCWKTLIYYQCLKQKKFAKKNLFRKKLRKFI